MRLRNKSYVSVDIRDLMRPKIRTKLIANNSAYHSSNIYNNFFINYHLLHKYIIYRITFIDFRGSLTLQCVVYTQSSHVGKTAVILSSKGPPTSVILVITQICTFPVDSEIPTLKLINYMFSRRSK